MSLDVNNRQKNFRLKRQIGTQEDTYTQQQLDDKFIEACQKLRIDENIHWTKVIERVTKVFWKGTKDVEAGFEVLDSLLQNAPLKQSKEVKEDEDVFTKEKVAETIINERMLFYIKSFL